MLLSPSLLGQALLLQPRTALPSLASLAVQQQHQQRRSSRKHRFSNELYSKLSHDFIHGRDDNTQYKVEGVSDKMYPIKLDWVRPNRVRRRIPEARGSGDVEPLPEVDLARQPLQ